RLRLSTSAGVTRSLTARDAGRHEQSDLSWTSVATIAFRPLEADDFPMLVEWFAEPSIARWWNEPADLSSVESKYGPRVEGREPTSMWIVEIEGRPGGLLQCYRHVDHPEHDACVGVPDAVGIDYLIGNAHRG